MLSSLSEDMSRALSRSAFTVVRTQGRRGRGCPAVKAQGPGLDRSALAEPAGAFLMKDASATGWAVDGVCEPVSESVVAAVRSAINPPASVGMGVSGPG